MYCATCDRWEHSDLGLDLETCMRCRGILCQPDDEIEDDEASALTSNEREGQ